MKDLNQRPLIGITMGDPGSIGPEISLKLLAKEKLYEKCRPLIIGDAGCLERAKSFVDLDNLCINPVESPEEGTYKWGTVDVLDMKNVDLKSLRVGEIDRDSGEAAFQYVDKVIELALSGQVDATVTNAISKEAINLAGHHYSGHTEIYAEKTGTEKYTMMLAFKNLRVVHVSTHCSLRDACDRVKKDRVSDVIRIAHEACIALGIEKPRIAVAGLNPHSGEHGMFGREEIDEITPAINEAVATGINAEGPIPPDTVFSKALGGMYDMVVAMYHDQGHIPLKVLGFVYDDKVGKWKAVEGVNITLGLPIIRVSVDHGTAFDQAGTGMANELSLKNAVDYAVRLANNRKKE